MLLVNLADVTSVAGIIEYCKTTLVCSFRLHEAVGIFATWQVLAVAMWAVMATPPVIAVLASFVVTFIVVLMVISVDNAPYFLLVF